MTDLPYGWTFPVYQIFAEVREERYRQLKKWGDQHHPLLADYRDRNFHIAEASDLKDWNAGELVPTNWADILLEEIHEAFAEEDPAKARAELVQCAAVIFAIITDIDSQSAKSSKSSPKAQSSHTSVATDGSECAAHSTTTGLPVPASTSTDSAATPAA